MQKLAIKAIKYYKSHWSPKLAERGVHCIYETTCSQYALSKFQKHNIFLASILTITRLLSCNPINAALKSRRTN